VIMCENKLIAQPNLKAPWGESWIYQFMISLGIPISHAFGGAPFHKIQNNLPIQFYDLKGLWIEV